MRRRRARKKAAPSKAAGRCAHPGLGSVTGCVPSCARVPKLGLWPVRVNGCAWRLGANETTLPARLELRGAHAPLELEGTAMPEKKHMEC